MSSAATMRISGASIAGVRSSVQRGGAGRRRRARSAQPAGCAGHVAQGQRVPHAACCRHRRQAAASARRCPAGQVSLALF